MLQIYLKSVECHRLQEHNDDELYCYVFRLNDKGHAISEKRFPEKGFWRFHHGERIELNQLLFSRSETGTDFLSIVFKEEDVPNFDFARKFAEMLRSAVSFGVPEMVDDHLGTLFIALKPDNSIEWKSSLNLIAEDGNDSVREKAFVLTIPDKFRYSGVLEIIRS